MGGAGGGGAGGVGGGVLEEVGAALKVTPAFAPADGWKMYRERLEFVNSQETVITRV